jgi:DNA-binding NtrC family response regulator
LESRDLAPDEIAQSISVPSEADALHRQLRQLRRDTSKRYSIAGLAGESATMRQVRSQVAAAARSRAHVLITGNPGSGRSHVARAIHFASPASTAASLVTLDCRLLTEDMLRRGLDALRRGDGNVLPTLLLLEIGHLPASFQRELAKLLTPRERDCQILGTIEFDATLDDDLQALIGTISIELPPLNTRLGDLPLLAQLFLEESNVDSSRQVGSISPAAVEQLALYAWPGEVEELQSVIAEAHGHCQGHEIQVADLPATLHHASQAAQYAELPMEMISLEAFMAGIERELVLRSLDQAQGNKALAARLLGITRPRLYRRLVQLGLLGEEDEEKAESGEEFSDDEN